MNAAGQYVTPYVGSIANGFGPGKYIRIDGVPFPITQGFFINLQCGPSLNPPDDIALHIRAIFQERAVARNSLINARWGVDERTFFMPFTPNESFHVVVTCDPSLYKIIINGFNFAAFFHRLPPQRVSHVSVDGDLRLISVQNGDFNMPAEQVNAGPSNVQPTPMVVSPPNIPMVPQPPPYMYPAGPPFYPPQQQGYQYAPGTPPYPGGNPQGFNPSQRNSQLSVQNEQQRRGLGSSPSMSLRVGAGLAAPANADIVAREGIGQVVRGASQEVWGATGATVEDVGCVARGFVEDVVCVARGFVEDVGCATRGIGENFENVAGGVKEDLGSVTRGVVEDLGGATRGVIEDFGGATRGIDEGPGVVVAGVRGDPGGFTRGVEDVGGRVTRSVIEDFGAGAARSTVEDFRGLSEGVRGDPGGVGEFVVEDIGHTKDGF